MTLAKSMTMVLVGAVLSLALGFSGRSQTTAPTAKALSRITRLDITSRRPAFGGTSFGTVGPYEILIGTAYAVADPKARQNAGIVDIDNARRGTAGLIEYSFDFQILKPLDLNKGNRVLLYEVSNRGRGQLYAALNEGGLGYEANNAGNGFIMNAGYTYILSGWSSGTSGTANPPQVWADLPLAEQRTADHGHEHGRVDGAGFGWFWQVVVSGSDARSDKSKADVS
jgi:hypothetical protein